MRVLVIGQGGREHALAWKLSQSPAVTALFTAPGNPGTAELGTNVDLPVTAAGDLADWAADAAIDLAIVGPEAALAAGVVDAFRARGLPIFGPTRAAARLETSKVWAKDFMARHQIPTATYRTFAQREAAIRYVQSLAPAHYPLVVKLDGLAAGKGVTIAADMASACTAVQTLCSDPAARVVIEAFLQGFEVSFLAISDGQTVRPLACAHDYKHAHEGDAGPMTGGMGAYSPLGFEPALTGPVMSTIVEPTIRGMAAEGIPYTGILYAGLMLTADGLRVLEFNARFGDPETQVILPRWDDDLCRVLAAAATGALADLPPFSWSDRAACGVVLAAAGYPGPVAHGGPIQGLDGAAAHSMIFQSGTRHDAETGQIQAAGGRVLTVVGLGAGLEAARAAAYARARQVHFPGCWCRQDIAALPADSGGLPWTATGAVPGAVAP
jgi:phosphoribosylamine--glycine ligase